MKKLLKLRKAPKKSKSSAPKTEGNIPSQHPDFSYFSQKWGLDNDGILHLDHDDDYPHDPVDNALYLAQLLNDVVHGEVKEPYWDSSGHKRYHIHPALTPCGIEYMGERFEFGNTNNEIRDILCIHHMVDGEEIEDVEIDLKPFTNYYMFQPKLDTFSLAFGIWNAINAMIRS